MRKHEVTQNKPHQMIQFQQINSWRKYSIMFEFYLHINVRFMISTAQNV